MHINDFGVDLPRTRLPLQRRLVHAVRFVIKFVGSDRRVSLSKPEVFPATMSPSQRAMGTLLDELRVSTCAESPTGFWSSP